MVEKLNGLLNGLAAVADNNNDSSDVMSNGISLGRIT